MEHLLLELSMAIEKLEQRQQSHDEALEFRGQEWDYRKYDFHLGAREAYEASSSYLRALKSRVEKAIQTPEA
jgi:hypothetical protein